MRNGGCPSARKDFDYGLICAIAQDYQTGEVLMQAYMNAEALDKTLETGYAHYYSRSRNCLWKKGETSGHTQKVISAAFDCDRDCLLMQVEQKGAACHTGNRSCFFDSVVKGDRAGLTFLGELARVVEDRKKNPVEGSYTAYLFSRGVDKIAKKMGEEAVETVIASKNDNKSELTHEISDLIYHLLVLMEEKGVTLADLCTELEHRHNK